MELNERETLVRVEQQLKDSVQNQGQIIADLKEIFGRVESDSKMLVVLSSEQKSNSENYRFRWDEIEKKICYLTDKIRKCEELINLNASAIGSYDDIDENIRDCKEAIEENSKALITEKEERSLFQQDITSTIKTIGWIFGGLATIAAILSGIVLITQIFGKLKGIG